MSTNQDNTGESSGNQDQ